MASVGIRELKNQLTRYLRRTRKGEPVVITDRGQPIAILDPIPTEGQLDRVESRLARLAAQGYLTLPSAKPVKGLGRVRVAGPPLSQVILEDRR